uniref:Uncharacterized protein n=1 Tax=Magallana gigas TaxID=29159 RepID=K1Q0K7_MAGGI
MSEVMCAACTKSNGLSASDDLVLKITLPLTVGLIVLLLCLVGVVLYKSPCSKQDGVNDYQRDRQTEGNNIYQDASTNITGDTSGYVTIACNKKEEEEAVYDHLRQDANET